MATYTSIGRTNYWRPRDVSRLEELLEGSGIQVEQDADGRVVLLDTEGTDWMLYSDDEDYDGTWIPDVIAEHLAPGEIVIFQTIGHEKLRFLNGQAAAVSHTGQQVNLSIEDIYRQAAEAFGVPVNTINRAVY